MITVQFVETVLIIGCRISSNGIVSDDPVCIIDTFKDYLKLVDIPICGLRLPMVQQL